MTNEIIVAVAGRETTPVGTVLTSTARHVGLICALSSPPSLNRVFAGRWCHNDNGQEIGRDRRLQSERLLVILTMSDINACQKINDCQAPRDPSSLVSLRRQFLGKILRVFAETRYVPPPPSLHGV